MEEEAKQNLPEMADPDEEGEEEERAERDDEVQPDEAAGLGTKAPDDLVKAQAETQQEAARRNSVSHRAEWARFKRVLDSKDCPVNLASKSNHQLSNVDLFNVWLDHDEDK